MIEFFVWFIGDLISTFGVSYLYCRLNNTKVIFNMFIIVWVIIGSLCLAIFKLNSLTYLSTCLYFIYYPILFNSLCKNKIGKLFYYVVTIWFCGILLDILFMFIASCLRKIIGFDVYSYLSRIVFTLISTAIFIILANIKVFNKAINNLFFKLKNIRFFDFAIISYAIFVIFIGMTIFFNLNNLSLVFLLIAIIILLNLSFGLLVGVRVQLIENNIFLKNLKNNNDFYLKIEDENRIFKHNLMAKLLAIKSVSNERARELIDDYIASFNNNMDFSLHIKEIPYGLNGIIYEKVYRYIGKLNIKIDNKIEFDLFERLKSRRYNVFVEKMIIAIDNAIESSLTSVDKILVINLYSENDNIIVDIKNSFSADLNLDKLGSLHYSTKKDERKNRGLGLFSILRNNEVIIQLKIINNLFVTKIIAKQKSDINE